jgi:hypothetical protein
MIGERISGPFLKTKKSWRQGAGCGVLIAMLPSHGGCIRRPFRLFIPCKIERHCDRDEETCWYNPIRHSCVIHVCNCERPINCSMLSWLCQAPVAIVPGKGCSRSATVMCRANAEPGNMPPAQGSTPLRILRRPVAIQKSKRNAA